MSTKAELGEQVVRLTGLLSEAHRQQANAVAAAEARVREQSWSYAHRNDELLAHHQRRIHELRVLLGHVLDRTVGDTPLPLSDPLWRQATIDAIRETTA